MPSILGPLGDMIPGCRFSRLSPPEAHPGMTSLKRSCADQPHAGALDFTSL